MSCMWAMPALRPAMFWKPSSPSSKPPHGTMEDVTMNHIFITDWANYQAVNTVYAEYFPGDKPARYCIQCGLVKPDALVEIATVAHIGK